MRLFKSADELLEEAGFIKIKESEHGALYERPNAEFNFVQVLDIIHKKSNIHIIQSYVKACNSEGFNNVVGITPYEMKLALKKFKELKKTYGWEYEWG